MHELSNVEPNPCLLEHGSLECRSHIGVHRMPCPQVRSRTIRQGKHAALRTEDQGTFHVLLLFWSLARILILQGGASLPNRVAEFSKSVTTGFNQLLGSFACRFQPA